MATQTNFRLLSKIVRIIRLARLANWLSLLTLLSLLPISVSATANKNNVLMDDQRFLLLREAAQKEDAARAAELASELSDYPIKSYVDYYPLKARLETANESDITDYLSRYAGTAIADRLRNDWLLILARQNNWATFDVQYPQFILDDDIQVKCYALLSKFKRGQNVASDARHLLTSSKVYGEGCYALFNNLVQSEQFSHDDIWSQIRWAAEARSPDTAIQLARLAGLNKTAAALKKTGEKLTTEFDRPLLKSEEDHQTALILLGRLAKADPEKAINALAKIHPHLSPAERTIAWAQIALPASQKLLPKASSYWEKATDAPLSLDGYQWQVRAALRNQDWHKVKTGIEAMPPSLLGEPAWVYWLGRAYQAENQPKIAQSLYQNILDQSHFYGQLALEESGQSITIPAKMPIQASEVNALSSHPGFRNALKFYAMNLRFEGNREWNWQLRNMSERQLLAAAEFARQNEVLDRMVNTSNRTKTIFDYEQRFPTPYQNVMAQYTNSLGLDMAWVYGLIRQESRFVLQARSGAGASGLMQVMPATARYVAKKFSINNFDIKQLNNTETNIMLGTTYLNMILNDLDGSQILASAGYNAGPGRAKAWRDSLPSTREGAIFIETIPLSETRDYVKNVLSNATYYSALFLKTPQSLKTRLGTITPSTPAIAKVALPN